MMTIERTLFEWASILDEILADYPEVEIILSTSWATALGRDEAAAFLPRSLQSRVVRAIWHKNTSLYGTGNSPRGIAVANDAALRCLENWFAIDDDHIGWPVRHIGKLIRTADQFGLSDPAVQDQVRVMLMRLSRN